jgi:transketolase
MRISKKKLIDEVNYPNYINSHKTRTKTVRDVWALALKEVGLDGAVVGLNSFGESGPGGKVMSHFGFTSENIVKVVRSLL